MDLLLFPIAEYKGSYCVTGWGTPLRLKDELWTVFQGLRVTRSLPQCAG